MKPLQTEQWMKILFKAIENSQSKITGSLVKNELAYQKVNELFKDAMNKRTSVWWVGNGGSSAVCAHLSQDIMNKLKIKSYYLNDASLLTCMANDYGYENVYKKPLELHANKDDLLIAISSSGNSENIVSCIEMASEKQMKIVTLSGMKNDNRLWRSDVDVCFYVPSVFYGIVEVGHEAILHGIIETLFFEVESR